MLARSSDTSGKQCARCHRPLVYLGGRGQCPRCLADFATAAQALWLDHSLEENPSTVLPTQFGHFKLVENPDGSPIELGSGATATTYQAHDTVLNTTVALKITHRSVAGHPNARARFLREARTAAKLHHPNVAGVSYYGEQDGLCYYVMQLVEGETLEARVRREGPLNPSTAIEVAFQVAHALAAAEGCGVIHRDLKPSNLMVVAKQGDGRQEELIIKVIDWGLAKAVSVEPLLGAEHTRDGFVGTPAFASPEQFTQPVDGRVDIRSDIYSLGVTLWYSVCGRTPFVGRTLEEIHAQQTRQPLPVAQLLAARVPSTLTALLQTMLAVHPRDRIQSARELLVALENCRRQISRQKRRRQTTVWLAAIGICGLCAGGLFYLRPRWLSPGSTGELGRKQSIAVLPFENLDADERYNFFVRGVGEEISGKLSHVAALTVVRAGNEPDKQDLAAIGKKLGVDYVLRTGVRRTGESIHCQVDLVDSRQPARAVPWHKDYRRPLDAVFSTEAEITQHLLARLKVNPLPAERSYVDAAPTTSVEAYDLYLQAAVAAPGPDDGPTGMRQALRQQIAWLERAVTLDPRFILAYGDLAIAHDRFTLSGPDESPEGRAVDHRALAEAALQKARLVRPDDGDIHIASAHHFNFVNHDPEQARVEGELARHTLPNEARVHLLLGHLARITGRWEEAIREFNQASQLSPGDHEPHRHLIGIYRGLRRYAEADAACRKLLANAYDDERFTYQVLQATGPMEQRADLEPLRALLAAVDLNTKPSGTPAYDEGRLILALCDRNPEGIDRVLFHNPRAMFTTGDFAYPAGWFAALAARLRHDPMAEQAAFAAARTVAVEAAQTNSADPQCMSVLAMIDAGLGRREEAVREGRLACEMSPAARSAVLAPAVATNLAVVYAWTDQPDQAFALLNGLVDQAAGKNWWFQVTYGDLLLNPVWDPLRADPRFKALVDRLAPPTSRH